MIATDLTRTITPEVTLDWKIVKDTRNYIVAAESIESGFEAEISRSRLDNSKPYFHYYHFGSNVTSITARRLHSNNEDVHEVELEFISKGRRIGKLIPNKASLLLENHWMTLLAERLLELIASIEVHPEVSGKSSRSFFFRIITEVASSTDYDERFFLETKALEILSEVVPRIQPGEVGLTSALLSMMEMKVEFNNADEFFNYARKLGIDKVRSNPEGDPVFPTIMYATRTLLVPPSEFSRFTFSPTMHQNNFVLRIAQECERFWDDMYLSLCSLEKVRKIFERDSMRFVAEVVFSPKWSIDNFFPLYLMCLDKYFQDDSLALSMKEIYNEITLGDDADKSRTTSNTMARIAVARASVRVIYNKISECIQLEDKECWQCCLYSQRFNNEMAGILGYIPPPPVPENKNARKQIKFVGASLSYHVEEILKVAFLIDRYISSGNELNVFSKVKARLKLAAVKAGKETKKVYESRNDFELSNYIAAHLSSVMTRMALCLSDVMYEIAGLPVDNTSREDFVSISEITELVAAPVAAVLSDSACISLTPRRAIMGALTNGTEATERF
jgi:hypothetical protein